ncbi:hypothetical protein EDC01DRAFT_667867 [Geopyxis carbonaria]|nr:hypothetical protein EDC01DRAFT_667867 [Geopyxis carbonaria]
MYAQGSRLLNVLILPLSFSSFTHSLKFEHDRDRALIPINEPHLVAVYSGRYCCRRITRINQADLPEPWHL